MASPFYYKHYKNYLTDKLETTGPARGMRSRLAEYLSCQTAFVSQVLSGDTHFSLEHAFKINHFLKHDSDESHFFMLLVQQDRAGTQDLRAFFKSQIDQILKSREQVKARIKVRDSLNLKAKAEYYSSWYYAAIHILLSVPSMQNKAALIQHLKLSERTVSKVLDFLVATGLANQKSIETYVISSRRIHLGTDSPLLSQHHKNWRLKASQSAEEMNDQKLHYSLVFSLSIDDARLIKEKILEFIEDLEPVIRVSPEEHVRSLNIDFFEI